MLDAFIVHFARVGLVRSFNAKYITVTPANVCFHVKSLARHNINILSRKKNLFPPSFSCEEVNSFKMPLNLLVLFLFHLISKMPLYPTCKWQFEQIPRSLLCFLIFSFIFPSVPFYTVQNHCSPCLHYKTSYTRRTRKNDFKAESLVSIYFISYHQNK